MTNFIIKFFLNDHCFGISLFEFERKFIIRSTAIGRIERASSKFSSINQSFRTILRKERNQIYVETRIRFYTHTAVRGNPQHTIFQIPIIHSLYTLFLLFFPPIVSTQSPRDIHAKRIISLYDSPNLLLFPPTLPFSPSTHNAFSILPSLR